MDKDYEEFALFVALYNQGYSSDYKARLKDNCYTFPVCNASVHMSHNETKFYLSIGGLTFGRVWDSANAVEFIKRVGALHQACQNESFENFVEH